MDDQPPPFDVHTHCEHIPPCYTVADLIGCFAQMAPEKTAIAFPLGPPIGSENIFIRETALVRSPESAAAGAIRPSGFDGGCDG